jgi:hypothetical protein
MPLLASTSAHSEHPVASPEFEFADLIPFPQKLYTLLQKESPSIISWIPSGNAFRILDSEKFQLEVIPKYFKHTKFASFQRQLNLYGFRRVTKGEAQGAYVHQKFQVGKPDLVAEIRRLPGKAYSGNGNKQQKAPAVTLPASSDSAEEKIVSSSGKRSYQGVTLGPETSKRRANDWLEEMMFSTWDSSLPSALAIPPQPVKKESFEDFEFFENIDWTFEYDAEGVI